MGIAEPPFTLGAAAVTVKFAKRSAAGCTTGTVLDKGTAPVGELHIIYREQFRYAYIWEAKGETPYWPESAKDKWGTVEASGSLAKGDHVAQLGERNVDTKRVKIGRRRIRFILGTLTYLAPRSDSSAPAGPAVGSRIWIPKNRNPDRSKRRWKKPRVVCSHRWGIKGDLTFRKDPFSKCSEEKKYGMLTVWERWTNYKSYPPKTKNSPKGKHRWTSGMMTLASGTYAGCIQEMGKHKGKKFPSIWVIWEWDGASKKWVKKTPSAKYRVRRVGGVFIHPGSTPNSFLGCLSPGPLDKRTEWGFKTKKDTAASLWEILGAVGVGKRAFPGKAPKKWFIIKVDDPGKVAEPTSKPVAPTRPAAKPAVAK